MGCCSPPLNLWHVSVVCCRGCLCSPWAARRQTTFPRTSPWLGLCTPAPACWFLPTVGPPPAQIRPPGGAGTELPLQGCASITWQKLVCGCLPLVLISSLQALLGRLKLLGGFMLPWPSCALVPGLAGTAALPQAELCFLLRSGKQIPLFYALYCWDHVRILPVPDRPFSLLALASLYFLSVGLSG